MARAWLLLIVLSMSVQGPRGSIAGRIVDAATGQPIAGAQVSVSQADTGRSTTSESDGRYAVGNLGSGRYRLRVVAPGYLAREFGDAPPLGYTPIAPLGRDLTGMDVRLNRGATIAGRVVDDAGNPVVAVPVRVFRLSGEPGNTFISIAGRSMGLSLGADPRGQTDSRGEYRILAVAPGEYLVGSVDSTVATFAPGTHARAEAMVIRVGVDDERRGVDIRATRVRFGTIRGVVTGPGPAESPIPLVDVELVPDPNDAALSPLRAARGPGRYGIAVEGRFEFADVPAGRYTLFARPGAVIDAPGVWGRESIVVTPDSVVEPRIALHESGRVSGRLTATDLRVRYRVNSPLELAPIASDRDGYRARAAVAGDGSFAFKGLAPGRYRWTQSQTLVGTGPRVLSAFIRDQDVTDIPLVITATTAIDNLRLVVSDAATISGTVRDAAGAPTTAGAVVIASLDPRDWTEISRRLRLVRADTNGTFEVRALPAGRYRAAHVSRLPHERLWDAAFLSALSGGHDVTVTAGQVFTIDLRLN
jgi:protocatechuate 3,4-dioxygenase beta subunit